MHHAVETLLSDVGLERRLVADVRTLEIDPRAGRKLADAVEDARLCIAEVVDDADLVARLRQQNAGMRSDVAQAPRDENPMRYCRLPRA
jgi:hypothetical protein